MTGILIAAHGSRAPEAKQTLDKVVAMLKAKMPDEIIETGYMEFCDPNIQAGLKTLADKGVTDIKVIPYFLFDGIHIKQDIPEELEAFTKENSAVKVTLCKTLGADERLADILAERIRAEAK